MNKRYLYIIVTYIIMQLSGIIGVPILLRLGIGSSAEDRLGQITIASGYWAIMSFFVAFIIIMVLLFKELREPKERISGQSTVFETISWSFIGFFMALLAQMVAASIEVYILGIEPGSDNTQRIIEIVRATPLLIVVTSLIGPILEEIIFRKILFGQLYARYNFWIAAIVSSLIFAIVHLDLKHTLLYTAMGFTFSYLYVRTKRIIVPIFAHVAMNSFVLIMQLYQEPIQSWLKQYEEQLSYISFLLGGIK